VLLLGILLITYKRGSAHVTRGWVIYSLLFLIFGAAIGLVFKAFSKSGSGRAGDMMIVACIVMLISYTVICLVCGGLLSQLPRMIRSPKSGFLPVALVAGVLSCTYNRLNIFLSGELIGAVFFLCFNGGVVILSTVFGVLLLREKLNGVQLLGTALGVAGICVIGIF
jgi:drug/metabolite transporter (DMT)-like permease